MSRETVPSRLETIEQQALEALRTAKLAETDPSGALDFSAIAPKKPTWDLQQHIQPKLDKLERQTQKAIVEIIRRSMGVNDVFIHETTIGCALGERLLAKAAKESDPLYPNQ